ncbi:MAG: PEP-CTERM system histidine kinase PrsK [Myxococcales bacterium]|nr:PEP-CTERM system histidine kinase PrsK [Myxococcales bacterium]
MDVVVATHALCALVFLGLAALVVLHSGRSLPVLGLVAACGASGLWALAVALGERAAAALLDDLQAVSWVVFLGIAYRSAVHEQRVMRGARWALLAALAVGAFFVIADVASLRRPQSAASLLLASLYARAALCVGGLVLVEALLRQARIDGSWRVRYMCLGVGGLIGFDLFRVSEALLFQRIDPMLDAGRAAVGLIAMPLIAVAAARNPLWSAELNVARRAVFHAATVYAIALYLLALAAVGAALRSFGGQWGPLLQAAVFFAALLMLGAVWFSPSARSLLKLQFARYFFTHRHDYRDQWQRFAAALASPDSGKSLRERALHALADVVGSPGGGLWLRSAELWIPVVGGPPVETDAALPADDAFVRRLEAQPERILEFGIDALELRQATWLPEWLGRWRDAWLVVPLLRGAEPIGFAVLTRAPGRTALTLEDAELLGTVARHVASYLDAEQTTQRLEEARRFEELARGMAFIAHDLRNLANELALTLANARTHIQNPDFQRDLLFSMEDSVNGIQRLLDKLRGRTAERGPEVTDFVALVERSLDRRGTARPSIALDVDAATELPVACDPDRLVSMSGHLIQNAIDAAGPGGRVTVRLRRDGDRSLLEVQDDGPGMTPEFVRERLLHPFRSSKRKGFGLGLYECRQLARALGGGLAIESQPGAGTVARLWLPLAAKSGAVRDREESDVRG